MDVGSLQRSWDRQQEAYLPDRETRLAAMLDALESITGPGPRVLDLAGGIGSITHRLLARLPAATSTVLDLDPVLLAIAEASFAGDDRVDVVEADLTDPSWSTTLSGSREPFDAVLTATALHWLPPSRVAALYSEVRTLLRPGGLFGNADHMPDAGLPALTAQWEATAADRAARLRRHTGATDWDSWWAGLREFPELADAHTRRDVASPETLAYTGRPETSAWHITGLLEAGYAQAGLWWRSGDDALLIGINAEAESPTGQRAG